MNDIITLNQDAMIEENHKAITNYHGKTVFPINKALQRELKNLKNEKIGDLKIQIKLIREDKEKIFREKKEAEIKKIEAIVTKESNNVQKMVKEIMVEKRECDKKIKQLTDKAQANYEKSAEKFYAHIDALHKSYPGMIEEFVIYDFPLTKHRGKKSTETKEPQIVIDYNKHKQEQEDLGAFKITFALKGFDAAIKKEFEERYGEPFKIINEKIKKLESQFDEALLFADVAVVRDVYYNMKQADTFLTNLRNLELK